MSKFSENDSPVLDRALADARRRGLRLLAAQRGLLGATVAGTAVVAARGIVAVLVPVTHGSTALAAGMTAALVACGAFLLGAVHAHRRMERLRSTVQALEVAREALDDEPSPCVASHPYRRRTSGDDPRLVVTTDALPCLLHGPEKQGSTPRASMTRLVAGAVLAVALVVLASAFAGGDSATRHRWTFVDEAASTDVLGFRAAAGRGGEWSIEHDQAATGARSLVNRIGEEDAPPATLVTSLVFARDVRAVTRCRVSQDRGRERPEGACGLVFRYLDDGTHHVARIEADTGRIVLARASGGSERVLGSATARGLPGVWQELAVDARGDAIRVSWNGRSVIEVHDVFPSPGGGVGLWAPSSSEAYFDELAVEVFVSAPQVVEVLPLLQRRTS